MPTDRHETATALHTAYREARTTLRYPEPDVSGPAPLTVPDLFYHLADNCPDAYTQEDVDKAAEDGYDDGERDGRHYKQDDYDSRLRSFCTNHEQDDIGGVLAALREEFDL